METLTTQVPSLRTPPRTKKAKRGKQSRNNRNNISRKVKNNNSNNGATAGSSGISFPGRHAKNEFQGPMDDVADVMHRGK